VGTSKRLIATKDGRGTAHYSAPEILLAEASIPSYTNKVDIWGLGMIFFELSMGKRAFQTSYHIMQYFGNQMECPKAPGPPQPTLILSASEEVLVRTLWATTQSLFPFNPEVIPSVPTMCIDRQDVLNEFIALLLHPDRSKRPSIQQVMKLTAANAFATVIEYKGPQFDHLS